MSSGLPEDIQDRKPGLSPELCSTHDAIVAEKKMPRRHMKSSAGLWCRNRHSAVGSGTQGRLGIEMELRAQFCKTGGRTFFMKNF